MFKKSSVKARYEESDQMGFIHHSNHIVWMESARMDLFRECGVNYRELENDGFLLPVTKVVVKYVSPAFFDDDIEVRAAFTRISNVRIRIDYLMYRNDGPLVCYGYTEHCFLSRETGKPIRIPDLVRQKMKLSDTASDWETAKLA